MKRESFPTSNGDPLPGIILGGFYFVLMILLLIGANTLCLYL